MIALLALWLGLAPLSADVRAEIDRLEGQKISVAADGNSLTIDDIAGEGPPRVGVVDRRGRALILLEADGTESRLDGPLAIPRIAGPGYKVWVIGDRDAGGVLRARRLGVLRPPPQGTNASTTSVAPNPITSPPPGT